MDTHGNDLLAEQIRLETSAAEEGVSSYHSKLNDAIGRGLAPKLPPYERMMVHWYAALCAVLAGRLETTNQVNQAISSVGVNKSVVVAMHVAIAELAPHGAMVRVSKLAQAISRAMLAELNLPLVRRDDDAQRALGRMRSKEPEPATINYVANTYLQSPASWPLSLRLQVGTYMVQLLIDFCHCGHWENDKFMPAFRRKLNSSTTGRHRGRRWDVFMTPAARDIAAAGAYQLQSRNPSLKMMVVPPLPWLGPRSGGYVRHAVKLVRKKKPAAIDRQVLDGVSALQGSSMRVNTDILNLVHELWDEGGGQLLIPQADDGPPPQYVEGEDKDAFVAEAKAWHKKRVIQASDRSSFLKMLVAADAVSDFDHIWEPHNLDFRGRSYPIPAHFHHQGNDICRALLEWGNGKPIGTDGLWSMKVALAGCFGIDKVPFDERVQWVNDHRADIEKSAADPLDYEWWRGADGEEGQRRGWKKWQALGYCLELSQAWDDPSFPSHRMVSIDGSANGLQHYAAILRDPGTARLVNLIDADQPADIYAAVADVVGGKVDRLEGCEKFSSEYYGDERTAGEMAVLLEGHIDRKLVKRPVMTYVYSVTHVGAKGQVRDTLMNRGFEKRDAEFCARWVANLVMGGMDAVTPGAAEAMRWLRECAGKIVDAGRSVEWISPIGLHVRQPYYSMGSPKRIRTVVQRLCLDREDKSKPAKGRQKLGVAPNYIHSVDGSHMLMVSLRCDKEGIAFAGTHDSFASHACNSRRLGEIVREEFCRLHETPLLLDLSNQWHTIHHDVKFPDPPEHGSFDLSEVMKAQFAFH